MSTSSASVDSEAARYAAASQAAAAAVLRRYSTSFRVACRLLPRRVRADVVSVYALVRVADEVVDGGVTATPARALDELRADVARAMARGFSPNPVVHAFADVATRCAIDDALIDPFFASMRTDLTVAVHDESSIAAYIYGSAEVVGLMCLRIFLHGVEPERYAELAPGARALGAALQKVNFLRDLADDYHRLGRCYLPRADVPHLSQPRFRELIADAATDFEAGVAAIEQLPEDVRPGVHAAADLYRALLARLDRTPVDVVKVHRVRLTGAQKVGALARGATVRALNRR